MPQVSVGSCAGGACAASLSGMQNTGCTSGACMYACNLTIALLRYICLRFFRASEGADGARELLALTPCDLWPYMRGRTLWLVGDSMMQVGPSACCCMVAACASTMISSAPSWCRRRLDRHGLHSRKCVISHCTWRCRCAVCYTELRRAAYLASCLHVWEALLLYRSGIRQLQ